MFEYKSEAQLKAMTEAERDTYATEKRAYEAKLQKEAIEAGNESLKAELTAAQKTEISTQDDRTRRLPRSPGAGRRRPRAG